MTNRLAGCMVKVVASAVEAADGFEVLDTKTIASSVDPNVWRNDGKGLIVGIIHKRWIFYSRE